MRLGQKTGEKERCRDRSNERCTLVTTLLCTTMSPAMCFTRGRADRDCAFAALLLTATRGRLLEQYKWSIGTLTTASIIAATTAPTPAAHVSHVD